MTGSRRRHAREIPGGDSVRGAICDIAADKHRVRFSDDAEVGMAELGLLRAGVRHMIIDAAQGQYRLWETKTTHVKSRKGQRLYQICPQGDDCDVFVEFKVTIQQTIWVVSVHEDSERGRYR